MKTKDLKQAIEDRDFYIVTVGNSIILSLQTNNGSIVLRIDAIDVSIVFIEDDNQVILTNWQLWLVLNNFKYEIQDLSETFLEEEDNYNVESEQSHYVQSLLNYL